jgi:hypothetical protein
MNSIVTFALKQRMLMIIVMVFLFGAGVVSFARLNIEAYPDPVPPRVEVITQSPGQSAEEIERYITIPIEIQMAGIPHVRTVRTISLFGLSDVRVEFTYDFTYDDAEQRVINRLSQLSLYRSAVITAFQNVADSLRALQSDANALAAAVAAEHAAATSLNITRKQLELGQVAYLLLLQVEQTYETAVISLVQTRVNRYADTAALFQALGDGWWNRSDVLSTKGLLSARPEQKSPNTVAR